MGNKAFCDNEKVADECQSPLSPFMLFHTSDRPEMAKLRTKNVNQTDIEEPKINKPRYYALVEENVTASVHHIVTNLNPSFDSLVCLHYSTQSMQVSCALQFIEFISQYTVSFIAFATCTCVGYSAVSTFGVGRIERRFDVWQLRWARAAVAR